MDLLTEAQRLAIYAALHDVTDTFMKSPILYKKYIGNASYPTTHAGNTYADYDLLCLREPLSKDSTRTVFGASGAEIETELKLSFSLEDLVATGLVLGAPTWKHTLNSATDKLIIDEVEFVVDKIYYDGPLTHRNVLLVIECYYKAKQLI